MRRAAMVGLLVAAGCSPGPNPGSTYLLTDTTPVDFGDGPGAYTTILEAGTVVRFVGHAPGGGLRLLVERTPPGAAGKETAGSVVVGLGSALNDAAPAP